MEAKCMPAQTLSDTAPSGSCADRAANGPLKRTASLRFGSIECSDLKCQDARDIRTDGSSQGTHPDEIQKRRTGTNLKQAASAVAGGGGSKRKARRYLCTIGMRPPMNLVPDVRAAPSSSSCPHSARPRGGAPITQTSARGGRVAPSLPPLPFVAVERDAAAAVVAVAHVTSDQKDDWFAGRRVARFQGIKWGQRVTVLYTTLSLSIHLFSLYLPAISPFLSALPTTALPTASSSFPPALSSALIPFGVMSAATHVVSRVPSGTRATLADIPEELLEHILSFCIAPPAPPSVLAANPAGLTSDSFYTRALAQPFAPRTNFGHGAPGAPRTTHIAPGTALLLVCRRWLRVATPLVYRAVTLRTARQADAFARALAVSAVCTSRSAHLGHFVHALHLGGPYAALARLAALLPALHTLALALPTQAAPRPAPYARRDAFDLADGRTGLRADAAGVWEADMDAFAQGLRALKGVRRLTIAKPRAVYLTHAAPVRVLGEVASAVRAWTTLETATLAFRVSCGVGNGRAESGMGALCAALAEASALRTVRTCVPAVWNPALKTVAANPRLARICLAPGEVFDFADAPLSSLSSSSSASAASASTTSTAPTSPTAETFPTAPEPEPVNDADAARAMMVYAAGGQGLGVPVSAGGAGGAGMVGVAAVGLYMRAATAHPRLIALIRAGTPMPRPRAITLPGGRPAPTAAPAPAAAPEAHTSIEAAPTAPKDAYLATDAADFNMAHAGAASTPTSTPSPSPSLTLTPPQGQGQSARPTRALSASAVLAPAAAAASVSAAAGW